MDLGWLLLPLIVGIWFWWDTSAAKEQARIYAKQQCQQQDVQLLDDTVALQKTRFRRHRKGHLAIQRHFSFEFSGDGEQRVQGYVVLLGRQATKAHLNIHRIH